MAIADAIGDAISDGTLTSGAKLPPQRNLAYDLGVTLGTITRAYREIERRGLAGGEVGRGTFVLGNRSSRVDAYISPEPETPGAIELIHATPVIKLRGSALGATLSSMADDPNIDRMLSYQFNTGLDDHLDAGAHWIRRCGIDVERCNITLTSGAQQGLIATLMALAEPGDTILIEDLTFPGMINLARTVGYRLETVDIDGDGIVPESLDHACRRSGAKILYSMPTLHNPTVVTVPEERRREIAKIAEKYGVFVIEDDIWGPLADTRVDAIAKIAPEHAVYISALSKCLAGGLRIGYVHAPRPVTRKIRSAMRMISWMPAPLMAEIGTRWIADGTAEAMIGEQRALTSRRVAIAREHLRGFDLSSHPYAHHLWLRLPEPWTSEAFRSELDNRGVRVLARSTFAANRQNEPAAIRFCIGQPGEDALVERAMSIIADTLVGNRHHEEMVI